MENLTKRQEAILKIISGANKPILTSEIENSITKIYDMSRDTIVRDLNALKEAGLISSNNSGPSTTYYLTNTLLTPVDTNIYFSTAQDNRTLINEPNSEFFDKISRTELIANSRLNHKITEYRKKVSDLPLDIHARELERFVIDLAYKSSAIEGNTYSLLETEQLIKNAKRVDGKTEMEAIMILNHKTTFDIIMDNLVSFKQLNLSDILNIHQSLVRGLDIDTGIRKHAVGISGTNYKPLDNQFSLKENLERAITITNQKTNPIEKALVISGLIAYLQPFGDGNKRTARMVANAILLAFSIAPISYRNIDEIEYKKSIILIDEQHDFYYYKNIFTESIEFSLNNYQV
ncbi:MAG: Fic family protein [Candidatus Nomurabacteria bacterium]|jgi:Fic family protein|nr:Fic family protein [Candidatus Nomurabacteria bacterium]